MTILRDDGYLQTDEAVAASCFIGEVVGIDSPPMQSKLLAVWKTHAVVIDTTGTADTDTWQYPLLIHASVVAKVVGFPTLENDASEHIKIAVRSGLHFWLRAHTGEAP